ncbi:HAD hydrolase-like protein [Hymenobacter latericus]|uniref:HAD hydrolase-like protein n=1 Tax=Hymenobacter sp. YIM 151858-1 TaxID=2987688 RepID=UPI0029D41804|nr:HAD hydrolase-like protein [Hymenobacter sp. YIM 151858-1]
MSEKNEDTYRRILARYQLLPEEFLMIGNSLKSDVLPVARLGAQAVYVPYHTTWVMERVPAEELEGVAFHQISSLAEVPDYLTELELQG